MREAANTGLLVSVHHNWSVSASLEVFNVSRKGRSEKIYSFEEVSGSNLIVKIHSSPLLATGYGDVAYNPRRNILGAIPVGGKIAYHLYNFDNSKVGNSVKLTRKSKWHSQYNNGESN